MSTDQQGPFIVGMDFTPSSVVALRHAMRLAGEAERAVHAIHVVDTLVVIDLEEALSALQVGVRAGIIDDVRKQWAEAIAADEALSSVTFHVEIDNRIVGLIRAVRTLEASMLVLGAFGDRPVEVGFGTVATACLRKAESPVLLVRDNQSGPFRQIVVGVDFSHTSCRAVTQAAEMARLEGGVLRAVHAFEAPWDKLHYRAPTLEVSTGFQEQYRTRLEHRLREFVEPIAAKAGVNAECMLLDVHDHRSALIAHAHESKADLIVVGTRGRTNLRDMLLGSTAARVLTESPCSVLAVKPEAFVHPLAEPGDC